MEEREVMCFAPVHMKYSLFLSHISSMQDTERV